MTIQKDSIMEGVFFGKKALDISTTQRVVRFLWESKPSKVL